MLSNPECTLNHECIKVKNPWELSVTNAMLYYQPTLKEKQQCTCCSILVLHLAVYSWLQPWEQKREIKSQKRCCRRRQQKAGCTVEELPVGRRRQSVLGSRPPPSCSPFRLRDVGEFKSGLCNISLPWTNFRLSNGTRVSHCETLASHCLMITVMCILQVDPSPPLKKGILCNPLVHMWQFLFKRKTTKPPKILEPVSLLLILYLGVDN